MNEEQLIARGYERVCSADEVGQPMPHRVEYNGRGVLICREGDELWAVDEICPHENQSMRFGVVFGGVITCPHHQYRFKLEDGSCNKRCAPVQTYKLEVLEDDVWIRD